MKHVLIAAATLMLIGTAIPAVAAAPLSTYKLTATQVLATPRTSAANNVEPLSNGLLLSMTANDVIKKFGTPKNDDRTIGGGLDYADFGILFSADNQHIWHFTIKQHVRLHSGLAVGSSSKAVTRTFAGGTWYHGDYLDTYQQYKLDFSFSGKSVSQIEISPANSTFAPVHTSAGTTGCVPPRSNYTRLLGTWYGFNPVGSSAIPVGTMVIAANGTYKFSSEAEHSSGTYSVTCTSVDFTGPLAGYNQGHATYVSGHDDIEFYRQRAA